jgi:hypothetical protein
MINDYRKVTHRPGEVFFDTSSMAQKIWLK